MAILKKKPPCLSVAVLLIFIALFSEVIMGSACAKKLNSYKERTNINKRTWQGRKLNAVTDVEEEFIPESTLYGIIPIPQNENYGYIPW